MSKKQSKYRMLLQYFETLFLPKGVQSLLKKKEGTLSNHSLGFNVENDQIFA